MSHCKVSVNTWMKFPHLSCIINWFPFTFLMWFHGSFLPFPLGYSTKAAEVNPGLMMGPKLIPIKTIQEVFFKEKGILVLFRTSVYFDNGPHLTLGCLHTSYKPLACITNTAICFFHHFLPQKAALGFSICVCLHSFLPF